MGEARLHLEPGLTDEWWRPGRHRHKTDRSAAHVSSALSRTATGDRDADDGEATGPPIVPPTPMSPKSAGPNQSLGSTVRDRTIGEDVCPRGFPGTLRMPRPCPHGSPYEPLSPSRVGSRPCGGTDRAARLG
ncbi:hypothetical protein GCM10009815_19660 [Nocardioides marmoribigeumensis]